MSIDVAIGGNNFLCTATDFSTCGLGAVPPVQITVDYGDGSGSQVWTHDNQLNVFKHVYSQAGKFTISVRSKSF